MNFQIAIRQQDLEKLPRFQKKQMSLANTLESMYWIFEDKERGSYNGIREDLFDRISFDRSAFNDFTRENDILCIESPDTPDLILMAREEKGKKVLEELLYAIQKVTYDLIIKNKVNGF